MLSETVTVAIFSTAVVAAVTLFVYFHKRQPSFHIEKITESQYRHDEPLKDVMKIRVRIVQNSADEVRLSIGDNPLVWEKNGFPSYNMTAGDAGNLFVPDHMRLPDSVVIMRWGKYWRMRRRLKDIPEAQP